MRHPDISMRSPIDRTLSAGIGILVFGVPVLILPFLEDRFQIPKEAFFWFLLAWISFFWFLGKIYFPSGIRLHTTHLLVIGFLLLCCFSWISSHTFLPGLWEMTLLTGCVFFFFITSDVMTPGLLRRCLHLAFWAGVAASCYALLQHLGLDPLSWKDPVLVRERTTGTLGNPNFLGAYLTMVLPLGLQIILEQKKRVGLALHILGWSLSWMAMLSTLSRAAWVAFFLSILFFVFGLCLTGRPSGRKRLVCLALIVLATILFLPFMTQKFSLPPVQERIRSSFNPEKDPSLAIRLHLWKASLQIILAHPILGTGPGTFSFAYLPFRKGEPLYQREHMLLAGTPHNVFLETASNTGIPSLFILFGIIFVFFRSFISGWRTRAPDERLLSLGILCSGLAFWSGNLFGFSTLPTTLLWWFLLAASCYWAVPSSAEEGGTLEKRKEFRRRWPIALAGLILLFSAGMAIQSAHALRGNYFFGKAQDFREEAQKLLTAGAGTPVLCDRAGKSLEFFSQALLQDGLSERYWLIAGKFQEEWGFRTRLQMWIEGAIKCYRQAHKLNPLDPYPLADLGRLYGQMGLRLGGKYPELSIQSYRAALEKDPYNAHFWKDLGNTLMLQGRFKEAEEAYRKSLEILPGAGIHLNMGILYRKTGDLKSARDHFEEALRLEPRNRRARDFLENGGGLR